MTWFYMKQCEESGYKGHCGPVEILSALRDNLLLRGMKQQEIDTEISLFFLDMVGGMISINADRTTIEVDGLAICLYTQHLGIILSIVERSERRADIGEHSYYKLYTRFNCLCLLPEQYDTLVRELRALEPVARAVEAAEISDMRDRLAGVKHVRYERDIPDVTKA